MSIVSPQNMTTFLPDSCLCSQHLLAQWMCTKGDYRNAMTHEKEALTAFTSLVSKSLREEVKWVTDCIWIDLKFFYFFIFPAPLFSLEKITHKHAAAKTSCPP